jgi:hypothetical protein
MSETEPFKRPDVPVILLVGLIAVLAFRSLQRSDSPVSARENEARKAVPSAEPPRERGPLPEDRPSANASPRAER